jgi:hypothetical protein
MRICNGGVAANRVALSANLGPVIAATDPVKVVVDNPPAPPTLPAPAGTKPAAKAPASSSARARASSVTSARPAASKATSATATVAAELPERSEQRYSLGNSFD